MHGVDIPSDVFARPAPLRRAFERFVAATGLVLLSPVFLVVFVSGTPLVRRRRVGRFGREFDLFGFGCDGFIGRLPQLWNVLKGNLGLVGPPPAAPGTVGTCDPILSALPGLVDCGPEPLYYLQVRTFGSDLKILLRAIFGRRCRPLPRGRGSELSSGS